MSVVQIETGRETLALTCRVATLRPEAVFAYCAQPALLTRWWPKLAEIDGRVGDEYHLRWPEMGWHLHGRYLAFDGLRSGSVIRLEFPNPERTDRYTIAGQLYRITFRGSTVLEVQPRADRRSNVIPLYQRSYYRAEAAPARTLRRFAAERPLPLQ